MVLLLHAAVLQGQEAPAGARVGAAVPLLFERNEGQFDSRVRFVVRGASRMLFFTSRGMRVELRRDGARHVVDMAFVTDAKTAPVGEAAARVPVTYFRGGPQASTRSVGTFKRLRYRSVWPGVDVLCVAEAGRVKFHYEVEAGVDPDVIRLRYTGATRVTIARSGALVAETSCGALRDDPPSAWTANGVDVACDYELSAQTDAFDVTFRVGDFDRSEALTIDPAVYAYCGYIGGASGDGVYGVAVDGQGSLFIVGSTRSSQASFPVRVGPQLETKNNIGQVDAFVSKLDYTGSQLLYSGFLSGVRSEHAVGVEVDAAGHAYVAGNAGPDFPRVGGPWQAQAGAFVTKISPRGDRLIYSGVIGGAAQTTATGIAIDATGAAYLTGWTRSDEQSFPVRVGPNLTHSGVDDGFVAKVAADGSRLIYCGFVGGASDDNPHDVAVDRDGRAIICGGTFSDERTFPLKVGPGLRYHPASPIQWGEAFVARVAPSGESLEYCGYIAGDGHDFAASVAVDAQGHAYVVGSTVSTETSFPVAIGPGLVQGGSVDAFVAKVAPSGASLLYCGYIGGPSADQARSVAVDGEGRAHVCGDAGFGFATSVGPQLAQPGGGDGFLAIVDAAGRALELASYVGGAASDSVRAVAADTSGSVYLGGITYSKEASFPVTLGPDLTYNDVGGNFGDGFVAKVDLVTIRRSGATRPGDVVTFDLRATGDSGLGYQVASSFGIGPIPIDTRSIGLSIDALLMLSMSPLLPATFVGYAGTIGPDGTARATLRIPSLSGIVGVRVHTAFITLDANEPSGVRSISDTSSLQIASP